MLKRCINFDFLPFNHFITLTHFSKFPKLYNSALNNFVYYIANHFQINIDFMNSDYKKHCKTTKLNVMQLKIWKHPSFEWHTSATRTKR